MGFLSGLVNDNNRNRFYESDYESNYENDRRSDQLRAKEVAKVCSLIYEKYFYGDEDDFVEDKLEELELELDLPYRIADMADEWFVEDMHPDEVFEIWTVLDDSGYKLKTILS
jgi:hypothetical protein